MAKTTFLGSAFAIVLAALPVQASALIIPPACSLVDDVQIHLVRPMADGTALLSGSQRGDGIVYFLFPSNDTMIAIRSLGNFDVGPLRAILTEMIASEEQFTVQNILDRFSGGNLRSWTAEMSAELSNCLQEAS